MVTDSEVLVLLNQAKVKILEALAAGASIVKEIEIRGRMVKHNDLAAELRKINLLIAEVDSVSTRSNVKSARTRARLGR